MPLCGLENDLPASPFEPYASDHAVEYWQTKSAAFGQDIGGIDGHYGDQTKTAVQAVVARSTETRIGGEEAAQIDVALTKLRPDAGGSGMRFSCPHGREARARTAG